MHDPDVLPHHHDERDMAKMFPSILPAPQPEMDEPEVPGPDATLSDPIDEPYQLRVHRPHKLTRTKKKTTTTTTTTNDSATNTYDDHMCLAVTTEPSTPTTVASAPRGQHVTVTGDETTTKTTTTTTDADHSRPSKHYRCAGEFGRQRPQDEYDFEDIDFKQRDATPDLCARCRRLRDGCHRHRAYKHGSGVFHKYSGCHSGRVRHRNTRYNTLGSTELNSSALRSYLRNNQSRSLSVKTNRPVLLRTPAGSCVRGGVTRIGSDWALTRVYNASGSEAEFCFSQRAESESYKINCHRIVTSSDPTYLCNRQRQR